MDIDIPKLEQLTKINLTPDERSMLSAQLPVILDYVAKLQEVNTEGVQMSIQGNDLVNVWRDDVIQENEQERTAALALFPQKKGGALQVPSVGARVRKSALSVHDDIDS